MAHGRYPQHKLPGRQFPQELTSNPRHYTAANGDGITATVFLDQNGNETPETFSELDACPEHHGGPLEAAWNEVCDGDTETARAFDDALFALEREFDR